MQRGRQAGRERVAGSSVAGAHGGRWRGEDARGGRERREPGGQRNIGKKWIETGREVARYGGR